MATLKWSGKYSLMLCGSLAKASLMYFLKYKVFCTNVDKTKHL